MSYPELLFSRQKFGNSAEAEQGEASVRGKMVITTESGYARFVGARRDTSPTIRDRAKAYHIYEPLRVLIQLLPPSREKVKGN